MSKVNRSMSCNDLAATFTVSKMPLSDLPDPAFHIVCTLLDTTFEEEPYVSEYTLDVAFACFYAWSALSLESRLNRQSVNSVRVRWEARGGA